MIKDLTILSHASALARHAALRHSVTAENVANADTPGYKARTLRAFDPALADRAEQGDESAARRLSEAVKMDTRQASPDGNTVSIEEQLVQAVDAQGQHRAAMAIYKKTLELLRMSVQSR